MFERTRQFKGLTIVMNTFDSITDEMAYRALEDLNDIEFNRLLEAQEKGLNLILNGPTSTGFAGMFHTVLDTLGQQIPVLRLTVFFGRIIMKGIVVHELVHFDQWQRGDMVIIPGDDQHVMWKGEKMPLSNRAGMAYLNQPWEMEAHRAQAAFQASVGRLSEEMHFSLMKLNHRFSDAVSSLKSRLKK